MSEGCMSEGCVSEGRMSKACPSAGVASGVPVGWWRPRLRGQRRGDQGVALLLVLLFLALFLSVTGALVVMASTEARMSGADRARQEVRAAAAVALEWALQELAVAADWNVILIGAAASRLVEPPVSEEVGGWERLELAALTERLQRETDASNRWGPEGRVWRLFAAASLDVLLRSSGAPGLASREPLPYAVAWVADDPGDGDGNPGIDANGCVTVRAEAFGTFRSRQVLLATVRRRGGGAELVSWRESEGT